MKHLYFVLILFTLSCTEQVESTKTEVETECSADSIISIHQNSEIDYLSRIDTIILGDINFDNVVDTAIVYPVEFKDPNDIMMGPIDGNSITKIHFLYDDSWLYIENAIELIRLYVLDDINEDGIKEIALIPGWYLSCCSGFLVYSNHNAVWQKISSSSVWSCGDIDYCVRKIKKNKFIVPDRIYSVVAEDIIDTINTVNFPKFEPDVYDVIIDTNTTPGYINDSQIQMLKPHLKGLIAFYSGIYGSECDLEVEETCELTKALNLGKQGSKKHLDLIINYFPNDSYAESAISSHCYQRPSGASVFSEYNYLKITDYGNKLKVNYQILIYNRGEFIHKTFQDIYQYKSDVFIAQKRKLIHTETYSYDEYEEN